MSGISRTQDLLPYVLGIIILARYVPMHIPTPINVTLGRVAMVSIAVLGIGVLVCRAKMSLTGGDVAFLLLFVLLTASTAWSAYPVVSVNRVFDLSFFMLLYFGLRSYRHHSLDVPTKLWTVFLVVGVVALLVGICYTIDPSIGRLLEINSNAVARHLVAFLPVFVFQAGAVRDKWVRLVFFVLSASAMLVIFLGGSRSGILVLLVLTGPLVYLYATAADRSIGEVATVAAASLLTLVVAGLLLGVNVSLPLPTALSGIDPETIGRDRAAMYVLIADLLPDYWLMGIGYGSFQPIMATVHRKGFIVHNLFLRVWLGAGVLAVLLLGKVILRAARGFITQYRTSAVLGEGARSLVFGTSLLGLVLMGMFNPILTSPVFIILLALGCSMPAGTEEVLGTGRPSARRRLSQCTEEGT